MCCNLTDMKKVLEAEPICPMCENNVPPMSVRIADDPPAEFKALVALMKDPTATNEEEGENAGEMEDSEDEAIMQ
jgi:hypothetical protein